MSPPDPHLRLVSRLAVVALAAFPACATRGAAPDRRGRGGDERVLQVEQAVIGREGAERNTVAEARIARAEADAAKNRRSHALDREVALEELDRAETFELTDDQLYTRHQIAESRLDKELYATRADVAGRRLETSGELSTSDKRLGEIDAGKARLKLTVAERSLRSLRITAPHDGILILERSWRGEAPFVGDTVWPGQKIAEIPDLSRLEAQIFVLEADGAGLKPGLEATVTIEGRPGETHEATVTRVEPLAKTLGWGSPVRYFEATLSLARTDPETMRPGQRVRTMIRLEQVDDVLAVPRGAVFERDGERVVYRRENRRWVAVPVKVGGQSVSRVVVESGLTTGDRIALRDPAKTASRVFGGEEEAPPAPEAGP